MEKEEIYALVLIIVFISVNVAAQNQEISPAVKNLLMKQIDKAIHYIEDMKSKIAESNYFTREEENEIESNLNLYIEFFENKKHEIDSSKSIDKIRIMARDLKEKWIELRRYKNSLRGRIYVSRFEDIVKKARNLSYKIDKRISKLNADGEERARLMELKREFDNHINSIDLDIQKARKEFNLQNNREGYRYLRTMHDALREAFNTLKEMVREFRNLGLIRWD
ncbi:MAG: hypothetical protein DRO94_00590 [Candidatus Altiarchaeales archaeon]|nr:MAG: hypothetical protein DRO95_01435 [Candidatus Altiarchaeales archaeon]RLI95414.1 MAG: hypothetical protein DRO94_00590 [Candidatus Altiarchaeales archaeon]HDO82041.1 hypothetical protein [Candidatus Altiarchaeales archaeon]HEX54690.1 hypothetical protein [Candidatus Altiarchaeales archaeon]